MGHLKENLSDLAACGLPAALEAMGEKDIFGTKSPSYAPETMAATEAILSRAVMAGLNINMSDEEIERIISSVKCGAKTALR